MPLNVPGILAPLQFLVNPRIIVPSLSVKDIRHLNFGALKHAGYKGAIFDKDNCLTLPGKDTIVPEIEEAWRECRLVFGEGNIVVVSNTAGAHVDAGGIKAESVRYHLGVPVLFHSSMKPGYSCVQQVRSYFRSLRNPIKDDELIVVGDRLFTDMVLAGRIREKSWTERFTLRSHPNSDSTLSSQKTEALLNTESENQIQNHPPSASLPTRTTLGIWTTGLWVKEASVMRFFERNLLEGVKKWVIAPAEARSKDKGSAHAGLDAWPTYSTEYRENSLLRAFVRDIPPPVPQRQSMWRNVARFIQGIQSRKSS